MGENAKEKELVAIQTVSNEQEQLEKLIRHIRKVQDACWELTKKLLKKGDIIFARRLIASSMSHDVSKFHGIEYSNLIKADTSELLKYAVDHHQQTNKHHPEFWGGVEYMPRLAMAEMVCDWYARSNEFGTDLRQWIKEEALAKYNISPQGKVYKVIKEFVDLLLEPAFVQIK
jgi:hypothetical protein